MLSTQGITCNVQNNVSEALYGSDYMSMHENPNMFALLHPMLDVPIYGRIATLEIFRLQVSESLLLVIILMSSRHVF